MDRSRLSFPWPAQCYIGGEAGRRGQGEGMMCDDGLCALLGLEMVFQDLTTELD